MTSQNFPPDETYQAPRVIPGPPQLPPLVEGQKIKSGPFTTTVTRDMVDQRNRENQELYRAWLNEQQRRNMLPDEEGNGYIGDFKDATIRNAFIRKIFCILTIQLLFTTLVTAAFMFIEIVRNFMIMNWYLWVIALVTFIISYCAISCSETARRKPPYNYIFLCILTIAMSYLVAFVSVFYSAEVVLIAVSMTTAIVFIISFTATFCKFDLTMRAGLMMIIGWVAVLAIIVMMIILMFTYVKVLHLLIAIIGTLVISTYLYFDVQVIMGGRRIELSPDEVVFATAQLYVDIVLLYQYVLMFMGLLHDG